MANKFTKSILERQAKEAKEQHQPAPISSSPEETKEKEKIESNTLTSQPKPPLPKKTTSELDPNFQLDQLLETEEGRLAKNKTFYLDKAVIDAIHKAAKSRGMTDSKLVNEILKKILL